MSQPMTVDCPTCGAPVEWTPESKFRPFCSDRCKLIDLGAWLKGWPPEQAHSLALVLLGVMMSTSTLSFERGLWFSAAVTWVLWLISSVWPVSKRSNACSTSGDLPEMSKFLMVPFWEGLIMPCSSISETARSLPEMEPALCRFWK